jgi:hypothetical protein
MKCLEVEASQGGHAWVDQSPAMTKGGHDTTSSDEGSVGVGCRVRAWGSPGRAAQQDKLEVAFWLAPAEGRLGSGGNRGLPWSIRSRF